MDPDTTNFVILHVNEDKKYKFLAMPSSGKLLWVQGMGVKKSLLSNTSGPAK